MSYYFILREDDFLWKIEPQSDPWSPNYLENFSVLKLLMEISKCWKIAEFPRVSIKIKPFKTFCEAQTPSCQKWFSLPPDKSFIRLSYKTFLMEIYRNIQMFPFQVLWEWSSWASGNRPVHFFFWHKPKTCLLEVCKVSKVFGCVGGVYFLQCWVSWGF